MKKRMERIGDELFQPLTIAEQKRITATVTTTTVTTAYETYNPSPDFTRDGDNE